MKGWSSTVPVDEGEGSCLYRFSLLLALCRLSLKPESTKLYFLRLSSRQFWTWRHRSSWCGGFLDLVVRNIRWTRKEGKSVAYQSIVFFWKTFLTSNHLLFSSNFHGNVLSAKISFLSGLFSFADQCEDKREFFFTQSLGLTRTSHVSWLLKNALTLFLPSSESAFSQPSYREIITEGVRIGSIIISNLSKLRNAKFIILSVLYFWWGCRGNLKLITLGSERVEFINKLNNWKSILYFVHLSTWAEDLGVLLLHKINLDNVSPRVGVHLRLVRAVIFWLHVPCFFVSTAGFTSYASLPRRRFRSLVLFHSKSDRKHLRGRLILRKTLSIYSCHPFVGHASPSASASSCQPSLSPAKPSTV